MLADLGTELVAIHTGLVEPDPETVELVSRVRRNRIRGLGIDKDMAEIGPTLTDKSGAMLADFVPSLLGLHLAEPTPNVGPILAQSDQHEVNNGPNLAEHSPILTDLQH